MMMNKLVALMMIAGLSLSVGCNSSTVPDNGDGGPILATLAPPSDDPGMGNGGPGMGQGGVMPEGMKPAPAPPPPTHSDGILNDGESGKDCGGSAPVKCPVGEGCKKVDDCETGVCSYKGVCLPVSEKSCSAHFGGDTCGLGETGDPLAQHESCCKRDKLPSGVSIGRYKITAGRMRSMIEKLDGNIQGWYEANKASFTAEQIAQVEPNKDHLPNKMRGDDSSVVAALFGNIIEKDRPSLEQGCSTLSGAGTHTYHFSDADNALYGDPPQGYSEDTLNQLPINCISQVFLSAFCLFDGGKLETFAENKEAYGADLMTHAWDDAGGWGNTGNGWNVVGPSYTGFDHPACPTCNPGRINWANNYNLPEGPNPKYPFDYSYWISAPGRFPQDVGPFGGRDVAGLMLEITATPTGNLDLGRPTLYWGTSGSWEGHATMKNGGGTPEEPYLTVYAKASGRCSYPL